MKQALHNKTNTTPTVKSTRKWKPIDWAAAKAEYVNDASLTLAQIAHKYGVKMNTVEMRCYREHWTDERAARNRLLVENVTRRSLLDTAQELAVYNQHDLQVAKDMRAIVVRKLDEVKNEVEASPGQPVSLCAQDIRALAGAVESAQRIARLALGATTENTVISQPTMGDEIDLESLTDEEFKSLDQLLDKAAAAARRRKEAQGSATVQ